MTDTNAETTAELETLVAGLSGNDLILDLGGGWTVTTALGHIAFWDRQQRLALAAWQREGGAAEDDYSINESLDPLLTALVPSEAARLVVEAARDVDQTIADAAPELVAEIAAGAQAYIVSRAPHRREHMEQIERALASRC